MKKICVYCGSSEGNNPVFRQAAQQLARELVSRDLGLVYGGASVGIMGVLANAVMELGGEVTGIIPHSLIRREISNPQLSELQVVDSMHQRKAAMAEQSDAFIAFPGGMGTLEELFEILTWAQLGFHQKPCGILNINGYYDHLLEFLDHSVAQGFLKPEHHSLLSVAGQAADILDIFSTWKAPQLTGWIKEKQQL